MLILALAVAPALALVGCGQPRAVRLPDGRIVLTLSEYKIRPQTVVVPLGRIRLYARNVGVQPHNIVVEALHRDSGGNAVRYGSVTTVLPGATGESKVIRLQPGRYLLVSSIANQAELGMNGTLIVK
jgi:hypothetical protein